MKKAKKTPGLPIRKNHKFSALPFGRDQAGHGPLVIHIETEDKTFVTTDVNEATKIIEAGNVIHVRLVESPD